MAKDVGQTFRMSRKLIESPPPSALWWLGLAWFASGVALLWMTQGAPSAAVFLGLVILAVGGVLLWIGTRRLGAERAFNGEWARAKVEWDDLRRGAAVARTQGKSIEDYLREHGYRVPGVVRAIAHDLSVQAHAE